MREYTGAMTTKENTMDAIEKFLKDRNALVAFFVSEEYETNEQCAEAIISAGWIAPGQGDVDTGQIDSSRIEVSQDTWDHVIGEAEDG